mgnify:CR=1 FL=1
MAELQSEATIKITDYINDYQNAIVIIGTGANDIDQSNYGFQTDHPTYPRLLGWSLSSCDAVNDTVTFSQVIPAGYNHVYVNGASDCGIPEAGNFTLCNIAGATAKLREPYASSDHADCTGDIFDVQADGSLSGDYMISRYAEQDFQVIVNNIIAMVDLIDGIDSTAKIYVMGIHQTPAGINTTDDQTLNALMQSGVENHSKYLNGTLKFVDTWTNDAEPGGTIHPTDIGFQSIATDIYNAIKIGQ